MTGQPRDHHVLCIWCVRPTYRPDAVCDRFTEDDS